MIPRRYAAALSLLLIALLLAPPPVIAQSSSDAQSTFTSNSELVLVPVQVLDHVGQPLHGLKQEQFVILSDDKPQQIAVFQEVQHQSGPPRSGDLLRVSAPAAEAAPGPFSNVPTNGFPEQSLVLAIDLVNTSSYLQVWTKHQVLQYLQRAPLNVPTAIVALTPDGLRQFQGFTTDISALVEAVQRIGPRTGPIDFAGAPALHLSFTRPGTYESSMADIELTYGRSIVDAWNAIFASLRSFDEMAWAYAGIPGRKTVAWFTSGFPVLETYPDPPPLFGKPGAPIVEPSTTKRHFGKHLLPEFQRTFAALARSNVVLYPVDVTGLPEDRQWDVWNGLFNGGGCGMSLPLYQYTSSLSTGCGGTAGWLDRIGIKEIADGSGGKVCTAGHNVGPCLDQARTESSDYYLLGFYVPQAKRVAGWHELRVNVGVDHGEVRSRAGYLLEASNVAVAERNSEMDRAIHAAVEYTGFGFKVEPGTRTAGSAAPIVFKVTVPASSIVLVPGENQLSFDVIAVALSDRGTPLHNDARIVHLDIPRSKMPIALTRGWNLLDSIEVSNRVSAVKVLVRDNVTGKIGSVVIPVPGVAVL